MIQNRTPGLKFWPAALLAAGLTACTTLPDQGMPRMAAPPPRPASPAPAPADTEKSAAIRAYYTQIQASLLAQGRLRTDGGGQDTPFDARILAENFIRIALYDEYSRQDGAFKAGESSSILRRWDVPIRFQIHFGASVPADRRAADRARIASYLKRLSDLTRHPITLVDQGGNFSLYVVSEDEREALGPALRSALPGLSTQDVTDVTGMQPTTYCLVYALSDGDSGNYRRAVAVVRAEHPDLLRQSCYHEEIAQGLGLANDSPRARPSIFNDDEEFALLTRQDELMLKILYDPEMWPGMTEAEAAPVVRRIAQRLMGGGT
ncbi:DUF2927 domain-containing protein [Xinfangfangia sp. D13-10-4-6]|uniref:DUF2927 domain-containing protein n=1 Tax=Pseudogemmobacter hezensis TaxID=2737662 RepID=UPI00155786E0|nr:DUF2927 domain-containing protein [Pseudogemmobacter hezensis]NPD13654.1 DUF2927 domain-containing protein [Pseudogemmobacter hezensis]